MKYLNAISISGLATGLVLALSLFFLVNNEAALITSSSISDNKSVPSEQELTVSEGEKPELEEESDGQVAISEITLAEKSTAQTVSSSVNRREGSTIESNEETSDSKSMVSGNFDASEDEVDADAPLRLSQRVLDVLSEVQRRQLEGQWEEALNEMNALYTEFDELNSIEQSSLLNFYTNTLLQLGMIPESISAFSLMLSVPDLRPDTNARALMALGQLNAAIGEPELVVSYLEQWLEFTKEMETTEEQNQTVRALILEASKTLRN